MRQILPRTGFRLGTKIGLVLWSVFILAVEKLAWFLSLFLQPVFDWFYLRDHDQRSYAYSFGSCNAEILDRHI